MADSAEWGGLEAQFVTQLREKKVEPVPEAIVKLAQKALKGAPHPDGTLDSEGNPILIHSMSITFDSVEKAVAFEKHMKNAGGHTDPLSSVTVVRDPERERIEKRDDNGNVVLDAETQKPVKEWGPVVEPKKVAFRVGARRGRAAGS